MDLIVDHRLHMRTCQSKQGGRCDIYIIMIQMRCRLKKLHGLASLGRLSNLRWNTEILNMVFFMVPFNLQMLTCIHIKIVLGNEFNNDLSKNTEGGAF